MGQPSEVFVYCDRHEPRMPVRKFARFAEAPRLQWIELPLGGAKGDKRWSQKPLPDSWGSRYVFEIVCRKCPRHPVPAKRENLVAVLTDLADDGVSEVSLSDLAAKLAVRLD